MSKHAYRNFPRMNRFQVKQLSCEIKTGGERQPDLRGSNPKSQLFLGSTSTYGGI